MGSEILAQLWPLVNEKALKSPNFRDFSCVNVGPWAEIVRSKEAFDERSHSGVFGALGFRCLGAAGLALADGNWNRHERPDQEWPENQWHEDYYMPPVVAALGYYVPGVHYASPAYYR